MSSLRGRCCRRSKKTSANPYAGRGLDKFSLVSAELEAKREKLAAQLDTPLSMVKFAIGSHNKWIPIILSRSTKKGSHGPKKKSTGLVAEDKPVVDGSTRKGAHVDGITDKQRTQLSGFINDNIAGFISENKSKTLLNGLSTQEQTHLDSLLNEDEAHLNHQHKTTLGGLLGIQRNDMGEIVELFSASSDADHISAAYDKEAEALQGHNAKSLMGAAWVVSKASTLASNVVFLRWHTKSMGKNTASAEKAPKGEIVDEARTPRAAMVSSSPSPLENTPAPSPFQAHQLLPLPSPPARVKIASNSNTADQAAIAETMEDTSTPSKQHRKCKPKGFLKMRSAPCTPRDSREPQKLFTAASALPETHGLNDQATHTDGKEERSIVQRATNPQNTVIRSRLSRVSTAEKAQKERARRVGQALAATGLALSLSGLMMGYISAILGVVCWWYVLPSLRKAVGDKPTVRSHSHDTNNTKTLNVKSKSNKAKQVGSGKYDLQSHEYKKKVIMEGLLDRGRRSNA